MTVFTPLTTAVNITPSTTAVGGGALPTGEALASVTLGIRPDQIGSAGTYPLVVIVQAPATSESKAALLAALNGQLTPGGNYWMAGEQTDTFSGQNFTSAWSAEIPFSLPLVGVAPDAPSISVN